MSIISFSGSASYTSSVENVDINLLEKQISNLQQQIMDVNLGSDDQDKKLEAIKKLQAQIQVIQMKMQQMEEDKKKEQFSDKQSEEKDQLANKRVSKIDVKV